MAGASTEGVLRIVNRHFPKVTRVKDAEENLKIEVTAEDDKKSKKRNMNECAMAVACKRAYRADGVVLSRSVAYLIKGNIAIRFQVPISVSREITSFDRGAGFSPGIYHLHRPGKCMTLDHKAKNANGKGGHKANKDIRKYIHRTTGIRAILGSVEDRG